MNVTWRQSKAIICQFIFTLNERSRLAGSAMFWVRNQCLRVNLMFSTRITGWFCTPTPTQTTFSFSFAQVCEKPIEHPSARFMNNHGRLSYCTQTHHLCGCVCSTCTFNCLFSFLWWNYIAYILNCKIKNEHDDDHSVLCSTSISSHKYNVLASKYIKNKPIFKPTIKLHTAYTHTGKDIHIQEWSDRKAIENAMPIILVCA